jgi:hypothetical protein
MKRHKINNPKCEIFLPMVGGGDEVRVEDMSPDANVCVGDVQVGTPAPKP